jgi:hypothetical protein
MKNIFCFLSIAFALNANSQELVSAPFAIAGAGMNISRQPIISFGGGYNFSRLYTAANITVTGERNVPALVEARAGFIIGVSTYIVVYTGIAYEPGLRFSSENTKGEITNLHSQTGASYGMFITVPAPWDHMSFVCGAQLASFGNNQISSSAFIGIKARLSKGSPCD